MRHRYEVAGLPALAVGVIRDALDDIGPEPALRGARCFKAIPLRLAVKLPARRKDTLRWLVEDQHEVEALCTLSALMTPSMVYGEARERLAFHGLYEPRLDACLERATEQAEVDALWTRQPVRRAA
jgi:hypothetical protein